MGSTVADLAFITIAIAIIVIDVKRGFLATVIHFFKYVLAFVLAYAFGSTVAVFLGEHVIASPVKNFIYNSFYERYATELSGAFTAEQALDSLPSFLLSDSVREGILSAGGTGETLLHNMTDAVAAPIISVISNIFGYILAFVLSLLVLWLVAKLLTKMIEKLKLVGRLNRVLGFLLGVLTSILVLFALSSVIRFFWGTTDFYNNTVIVKLFGDSSVLHFLSFLDIGRLWRTG